MMRNHKGFTLIELVLVITVLGILAVAALPSFIDVSTNAKQSARDGVAGAVRSGVGLFKANDLVKNGPPGSYPATLDAQAAGATAGPGNLFFTSILQQGVADKAWSKDGADPLKYIFNDGTTTYTYTYVPAAGTFSAPNAP